jgi:hypothetical protein
MGVKLSMTEKSAWIPFNLVVSEQEKLTDDGWVKNKSIAESRT